MILAFMGLTFQKKAGDTLTPGMFHHQRGKKTKQAESRAERRAISQREELGTGSVVRREQRRESKDKSYSGEALEQEGEI